MVLTDYGISIFYNLLLLGWRCLHLFSSLRQCYLGSLLSRMYSCNMGSWLLRSLLLLLTQMDR